MAWVNFREVADRFSHIDGKLVSANIVMTPERSSIDVVLRFYPWWEHPLYLVARDREEPWGFSGAWPEGGRDVPVRAIDPCEMRLSRQREVTDIAFDDDHPLLWPSGPLDAAAEAGFRFQSVMGGESAFGGRKWSS